MDKIISFDAVTLDALAAIFDDAAIEYLRREDGTIYVTEEPFPTFWSIDSERKYLSFWTYIEVSPKAGDPDILAYTNDCNRDLILVQFSYRAESKRLYGHYMLSIKNGLHPQQAIRTGRRAAAIFDDAATNGIDRGLLLPLDCCDQEQPAIADTMH